VLFWKYLAFSMSRLSDAYTKRLTNFPGTFLPHRLPH
jgi:hypothetical protein